MRERSYFGFCAAKYEKFFGWCVRLSLYADRRVLCWTENSYAFVALACPDSHRATEIVMQAIGHCERDGSPRLFRFPLGWSLLWSCLFEPLVWTRGNRI